MPAKVSPQASSPGHTFSMSRVLHRTRISQKGRMTTMMGRMRPSMALKSASGRPVTATRVRTGLPIPPQATGAELAMRHMSAVWKGGKPRPIIMAPVTATGAPPPPAPSRSAPKAKAIKSVCGRPPEGAAGRRRGPPRSRRSGTSRTPCHRPRRRPPFGRACGTRPARRPPPPRRRRRRRATPECAARPGNRRAYRPVWRRPAWRGVYSPTDRNFAARAGSLNLDEKDADRSGNLQYATGRTQFIRFHGAAEGHPRVARHGSEGTVAEAAASRTNSGRALYNQALAGGPEVSWPDYTERPLVTQTARCERISHTRLKHSFSAACGDRANFCDANWLYTHTGWRRGIRWSAPVDSAGDRSYTSGIARPPGNFGLSDLEVRSEDPR